MPSYVDFSKGDEWTTGPDSLLMWLEHFFSGGTDMDVPLDVLPSMWHQIGAPVGKTDIIQITDAQCHIPDDLEKKFLAWKAAQHVRMISLVINSDPGDLTRVSDKVHRVRSLGLDEEGVAEVMSV